MVTTLEVDSVAADDWRPVAGFAAYEVSAAGLIRRAVDSPHLKKGDLISHRPDAYGYLLVHFHDGPTDHTAAVHRVVARAFLGDPPPELTRPEVNHIDGCKANNRVENLEWTSPSGNRYHAIHMGLLVPPKGEDAGRAKLTEADVLEIRRIGYSQSQTELAARYGVSRGTICYIRKRLSWRHI